MYKEIQFKISENAIKEMWNGLILSKMCSRPPSSAEEAIIFILKAIKEDKKSILIELKIDLKKKKSIKKKKERKK